MAGQAKDKARPGRIQVSAKRYPVKPIDVTEAHMVESALEFYRVGVAAGNKGGRRHWKGRRHFPTDVEIVQYVRDTFQETTAKAVAVLRAMKLQNARVVDSIMPALPQQVIRDMLEVVQSARSEGDNATAVRGLIGLGRFVGLDQPQLTAEQQVRQLSDAALEAALSSSIARSLETMSEDAFADLMRRREQKRLTEAKPADVPIIDAEST